MGPLDSYSAPPGVALYDASLERKRKFVEEFFNTGELGIAYMRAINPDCSPNQSKRLAEDLIANDRFVRDLIALARKNVIGSVTGLLAEHTSILAELRDEARSEGKFAPAIAAEIARGKALGLYDRASGGSSSDKPAEEMSTDELNKLMEAVARLPSSERENIARMLTKGGGGLLTEIEGHAVPIEDGQEI